MKKQSSKTQPALWQTAFPAQIKQTARRSLTARKVIYRVRVKQWLGQPENRRCRVFTDTRATQNHHSRGRLGRLLMDERFWIPVSAPGHAWIHTHITAARKRGLICEKGLWNQASV